MIGLFVRESTIFPWKDWYTVESCLDAGSPDDENIFNETKTNKKVNGNTKGSMFVIFRPSKMPLNIRLVDRNELLGAAK